jgi:hypothetical protein
MGIQFPDAVCCRSKWYGENSESLDFCAGFGWIFTSYVHNYNYEGKEK